MKKMKAIKFLFFLCTLWSIPAMAQDIEVTDSTSTEWGGGGGGGLNPTTPSGPVTSMTISQTAATLAGGENVRLVATVNADAANKDVQWSSSNSSIASVNSKGVVVGLAIGTATITATAAGNSSVKATCQVTVTSNYTGMKLPNVPFEFCYDAFCYDATTQSIPNHVGANLEDYALQLSENIPTQVDGVFLRITDRCEGYIDRWAKGSTESGAYFYREGQDCMTIVAKVAPKLNTGNVSDFISNRGGGYNYMWRIGDQNRSFLHTSSGYDDGRTLPLNSEEPQILAVRVDGPNGTILLQNLTTGDRKQFGGINWGGNNNIFKLFYNDGGEFFRGDFYWVYYSFELLTDQQLEVFTDTTLLGDANGDGEVDVNDVTAVVNYIQDNTQPGFDPTAADANEDDEIDVNDITTIVNIIQQQ